MYILELFFHTLHLLNLYPRRNKTDKQTGRETGRRQINILWYPNMHEFALSENTGLFLSKKGNKWKSMWAITWSMWTKCSCVSSIISHCIWSQNICLTKLHNGSCSLQKNFCNCGVQRITSTIQCEDSTYSTTQSTSCSTPQSTVWRELTWN